MGKRDIDVVRFFIFCVEKKRGFGYWIVLFGISFVGIIVFFLIKLLMLIGFFGVLV